MSMPGAFDSGWLGFASPHRPSSELDDTLRSDFGQVYERPPSSAEDIERTLHLDPQLALLDAQTSLDDGLDNTDRSLRTAPVLTGDVYASASSSSHPNFGVYGRILAQEIPGIATNPTNTKMMINLNMPFSTVVCGLQVGDTALLYLQTSTSLMIAWCNAGQRKPAFNLCNSGKLSHS
jgi:hypothetical protein